MAITVRKGYESQFDINKMLPGEFAVTTDSHKVYVCMAPGISKELASVEELQSVLGASDEAFQAFRELLNAMESDTVITGLLTDVNNLKTGEYTISFSEAETRENIENTNTIKVILGKIAKWLKDIKNAAFYDVANNMTTATAGTHVADAYQIKLLKNQVDEQNTKIGNYVYGYATYGEKFGGGKAAYLIKNKMCFVIMEVTPTSDVANGDILLSGLPSPITALYTSVTTANGNYSVLLNGNGELKIYYPQYTTAKRIDSTIVYPVS